MTRKHDPFRALSIAGGLAMLGAVLWYGPWLYRVATERLMLYRTCVEWSRASETLGDWAQTYAGCLGQVSRRRR